MKPAQTEVLRKLTDPSGSVRSKTLKSLANARGRWFKSEEEMKVLFESLFRTYWMADSSLQKATLQGIVTTLEDIASCTEGQVTYRLFWEVLNNNWPGIDRFRLNKYYSLVEAILLQLTGEDLLVTSSFALKRMSEVKRPTGLVIRLSELILRRIQDDKTDDTIRDTLCFHVIEMIAKFPLLPSFGSVTDVVTEFATSHPDSTESIKKAAVDALGTERLPSGSRPILSSILQRISLPPALA